MLKGCRKMEDNQIVPPDLAQLKESFDANYALLDKKHFVFYPRKTFYTEGIPSPRQYFAYKRLIKKFNGQHEFLESDLKVIDLRTQYIMLIDDYSSLFDNKKYDIFITSGYFYSSVPNRRSKIINFLKAQALNGCNIHIYTQYEGLERDFFNDQNSDILKKNISINHVNYRIDIHYTILQDLEDPNNVHFFLEYPHSEEFIFRLGIHFTYNDIINLKCDPKEVLKYLLDLRNGYPSEKFFHAVKMKFPKLTAPDLGLAVYF
jgi:hypothetical protein